MRLGYLAVVNVDIPGLYPHFRDCFLGHQQEEEEGKDQLGTVVVGGQQSCVAKGRIPKRAEMKGKVHRLEGAEMPVGS